MQKRDFKMGVTMSWRELTDDLDTEAGGTYFTCVTGAFLVLYWYKSTKIDAEVLSSHLPQTRPSRRANTRLARRRRAVAFGGGV